MFEPGKIVKCGGQDYFRSPNIDQYRGVAATFVLDMSDPNPGNQQAWISAQDMNIARLNHTLVILPDGKVLAVGGSTKVEDSYCNPPMVPCAAPVLEAEIFDPASGKWTLQPPMDASNPRMYHSAAMLLPDGRVVCAGGNGVRTAQIFDPEYIQHFNLRPSITSSPLYMQYGGQYNIQYLPNDGKKVSKVCLMRLAAVTHAFDQDQRRVPLTITVPGTGASPDQITVQAPANGNIAPPGYYMLFVLSEYSLNEFAPCRLAAYVKVGP
jgi:hypothetical protein